MNKYITSGERRLSIADLQVRGAKAASGFAALGVREGECVAMLLRNDLCMFEAMAGATLVGAYAVPVNWHWKGEEAGYVIEDCAARVIIVHADLWPQVSAHVPAGVTVLFAPTPPEIAGAYGIDPAACAVPENGIEWDRWVESQPVLEDPASLERGSMIYTSGTTGKPKGVRREPATPEQREASIAMAARGFGVSPGAKVAMTGPMYHSAPAAYGRMAAAMECDILLLPRFDPEALLQAIDEHEVSHMHVVPTMFARLLRLPEEVRAKYDVSSLKWVIHGAAPCPPEIKKRMIDWWGPVIYEYYGSTEAGLVTVSSSEDFLFKPGTVGKAQPGVDIRVVGDDGAVLPAGESGEIYMTLGQLTNFTYHNRDDDRRAIELDGYVTNGDIGYLDEDGYLFLNDRKRDMIISGGVNIYPAEIEAVLHDMAGIHDCAVFGIPDDEMGETVAAAVELLAGATLEADDIKSYLRQHIANYKVPREVSFHEALPREDSGKIFKRLLREPYWQEAGRKI
jgi:long-chain acyl-CoA synthetase